MFLPDSDGIVPVLICMYLNIETKSIEKDMQHMSPSQSKPGMMQRNIPGGCFCLLSKTESKNLNQLLCSKHHAQWTARQRQNYMVLPN